MEIVRFAAGGECPVLPPCAVALGFFDGVHRGHRALLAGAKRFAQEEGLLFAVLTFAADGGIKPGAPRIYGDREKLLLLEEAGAEAVLLCDFAALRDVSAEDFIDRILIGRLNARAVFCGFNFRFGRGAAGDAGLLAARMRAAGGCARILPPYPDAEHPLSATAIRAALEAGDVAGAGEMLGAPYFLLSPVLHGRAVGRTLGLPTANTDLPEEGCRLRRGVYLTAVALGGERKAALTNVGVCPTFGARKYHAETFIPDYEGDLYGRDIRIEFLDFLREERVFSSPEELKKQINVDILTAKERFFAKKQASEREDG